MKTMLGLVPGIVTSLDPPFGVYVAFRNTGQQLSYRVNMGRDWANAVSVRQKPLPQIGTWGLVAFPYDDFRNGIWICAYYPSLKDALTTTQSSGFSARDSFIDMDSHFSGDLNFRDGLGNIFRQWVDGSYFLAASGTTTPTLYRHVVDGSNQQQTSPFTYAERVSGNPNTNALNFVYKHISGTTLSVDPSGNVTVSGASAAQLQMAFGGTTLTIASGGLTTLNLAAGDTLNIQVNGASLTDFLALVSKLVTAFNGHTHGGVQTGGGTSSTPTSPWSSTTINSTAIKISN